MTDPDKTPTPDEIREAKKLLSRILGGGGVLFLLADAYFLAMGRVNVGSSTTSMEIRKTVTMTGEPTEFWAIIAFTALLGLGLIVTALKLRRG